MYFYRNESGTAEIEFLIEGKKGVLPIEVKAGRKKAKTLDNLLQKEDIMDKVLEDMVDSGEIDE